MSSQLLAKLEHLDIILREKASLVWTCKAGVEGNTKETDLETLRAADTRFGPIINTFFDDQTAYMLYCNYDCFD